MNVNDSDNISLTNWAALEAMTDEEIDYSDIPPLTEEFFEKATLRLPAAQARNLIQIESDIITWFKSQGMDYKNLINAVLRRYMDDHRDQQAS